MNIEELTIGEAREISNLFKKESITVLGAKTVRTAEAVESHPFIGTHCVIRTYSDGVHIGTVATASGTEYLIKNARRIYQWKGAFTLNEVAISGIDPSSRLTVEVPDIYLTQVISLVPTTEAARESFSKCGS